MINRVSRLKSRSSSHISCSHPNIHLWMTSFASRSSKSCKAEALAMSWCRSFSLSAFNLYRRELLAAQTENFQLEKKVHELQMSLQNPSLANRMSDIGNGPSSMGLAAGSSAPGTPNVVRKYYEMKYGDKVTSTNPTSSSTNNSPSSIYSNPSNFDAGPSNMNPLPVRNGNLASRGPALTSPVPQPTVAGGARNSTAFNLRNKLPNSLQNTLATTSQSLQSKLPASLQKLPASFTQGPTMNMLANKLQNAFS